MEQLVAVAKALRVDHRFGGYIHLKVIPGAAAALITEAGRWADRLSANVELAVEAHLIKLAPEKRHAVIETSMQQIRNGADMAAANGPSRAAAPRFAPAGQSTQMIVGAGGASDRDILTKSSQLYTGYGLRRVYYSAFPHSREPTAICRLPRRRWFASIAFTRPTGCSASTASTSAN